MKKRITRFMKLGILFMAVLISAIFAKGREASAAAVGPTDYELRWSFENSSIAEEPNNYWTGDSIIQNPIDSSYICNYSTDSIEGSQSLRRDQTEGCLAKR